ncbi:coproporphyrinogen III oxidase family protein [Blastopirellula sp. JC732]|uniref:Coproporphyrinogen III oxidase family protein n=1 Tax=Blastopirellula sediminis TaxID=2894196 RepID=A0A9X1MSA7_9BACT|nr:coproporphyrinogen-III oxidase family protein [Blastopirellula sediminis]MCC9605255.1 coproporphyrinogen III oxidase family protein [Blastopirellula sediminis]MCC9631445.1 coproporphyrinogen III oxidase family protein [Blastopirellula sediminis]
MATDSVKTEVGSYFISNYPPFSQWSEDAIPDLQQAMASEPRPGVPLGLYLHVPFCRKRCKFCYFRVYTDKNASEVETYVSALVEEIQLVSQLPAMGGRPFRFVYFGGGTPSFLSPKQLKRLEDRLRQSISWDQAEEVTFECEPGTLSETKVKALREMGVTRLSLGIENFSDKILEENGRAHLSKEVYTAWEWIEAAKFPNVNIDLIAGMVGETWDTWRNSVAKTLELSPESVTIYQMELPFNTVYSQDILGNKIETPVADWPQKRAWVSYAFDELAKAGYSQSSAYTMIKDPTKVSFSYRDNLFGGADLLATGVASFGHISGVHYQNKTEWADYTGDLLEKKQLPLKRAYRPTPEQLLIRETILLLKRGYLDVDYFQNKFGVNILDKWQPIWDEYVETGLATVDGGRIELTRDGLLRADGLLPPFFEEKHQGVRYT